MNRNIKKVEINTPCNENWNTMAAVSGGKYCLACQKRVIDFSKMSNQQVIEYLSKADNLCGSFSKVQFESLNQYLSEKGKKAAFFKNWGLAAIMLGLLPFTNTEAKAKPIYEQAVMPFKKSTPLHDSVAYIKIRGVVLSNSDDEPLPGVTIHVDGTNIKTITDTNGKFELMIPATIQRITLTYIGFEEQVIAISPKKTSKYRIKLIDESRMLGGLGVIKTKQPLMIANIINKVGMLFS